MLSLLVIFGVLLGILVLVGLWVASVYNNLVVLNNRVKNSFAQIDVQLKRRYDLIPNLVEAAKGYMTHERETLTAVIEARNKAVAARDVAAQNSGSGVALGALGQADNQLSNVLTKFMALSENYPDLKANTNIGTLMEELSSTENKVGFARQALNDVSMQFNIACQTFPGNLVASRLGFSVIPLLESTKAEVEREAPKVSF
jgi:LemA protein